MNFNILSLICLAIFQATYLNAACPSEGCDFYQDKFTSDNFYGSKYYSSRVEAQEEFVAPNVYIGPLNVASADECCRLCNLDQNCKTFAFIQDHNRFGTSYGSICQLFVENLVPNLDTVGTVLGHVKSRI